MSTHADGSGPIPNDGAAGQVLPARLPQMAITAVPEPVAPLPPPEPADVPPPAPAPPVPPQPEPEPLPAPFPA